MIKESNSKAIDQLSFSIGKRKEESLVIDINMVLELFDKYGNKKDERSVHNTMTSAGRNGIVNQLLAAPTLPKLGWCAVGTGSPGATLLGAEIARVVFDSKNVTTNVCTTITTFPAGTGTGALTEEGLFDVVTANTVNMWCNSTFGTLTKGASDSVVVTHTITIN